MGSWWEAVKVAKDINIPKLPNNMTLNNSKIDRNDLPDAFADFFKLKTQTIVNDQAINDNVFNGTKKVDCPNSHFMKEDDVINAIKSLNSKK